MNEERDYYNTIKIIYLHLVT